MDQKYPNRIKELRDSFGLTQHQLGMRFKNPKDATIISRWERGIVRPNSESLIELSRILGEKPEKIFFEFETDLSGSTKTA